MYMDFKKIVKEQGLRGWRLQEENDVFYFSKFDDRFNDDEFRFYLNVRNDVVNIKKMQKVKSYKKIMKVNPNNTYIPEAELLCAKLTEIKKTSA